jgi:antitoxin component of RelBE/YafQ-DinJ toxin-antitoxin module
MQMNDGRDPFVSSLASHLNIRLTRLADERDIPLDRLLDKSVELLLEYMEDNEIINDHVKLNNVEAINKNNEIIQQSRQILKKD